MSGTHTRLVVSDGYATLTLARPEIRNALADEAMLDEIVDAVTSPGTDVLVLTGDGPTFSARGNVSHVDDRTGMFAGSPSEIGEAYRRTVQSLTRAMARTDTVTIAAVNGPPSAPASIWFSAAT